MNLNQTEQPTLDPTRWTPLQTDICMAVANAKLQAFEEQAGHTVSADVLSTDLV